MRTLTFFKQILSIFNYGFNFTHINEKLLAGICSFCIILFNFREHTHIKRQTKKIHNRAQKTGPLSKYFFHHMRG